jgi:hypothetical protein
MTSQTTNSASLPNTTCPYCHRTSYHLDDVKHRYCGACNRFYDAATIALEAAVVRAHVVGQLRRIPRPHPITCDSLST